MVNISFLSSVVVAKEIRATYNIDVLMSDLQLLRVFKLDAECFLVAEEVKADEVIPGEQENLVFSYRTQLENFLSNGQSDGLVVHEDRQLV